MKTENKSGIRPTEYKVLVSVKSVDEVSKGGIIIPPTTKDREQFAQMEGVLVAVSPLAFTYDDWSGKEDAKPKVGDRVMFAKYAGADVKGMDGKDYRICNDKDLAAVLT